MNRHALRRRLLTTCALWGAAPAVAAAAPWPGLEDRSDDLATDSFAFTGTHPDMINSNENYYDGDIADFDLDGWPDRALGARYGLLLNTGEGLMTALPGYTGFLLRGMPGASGWGEDGFQWADLDNDLDPDCISGGNGEPLVLQSNRGGRFSTTWQISRSALNIVNTDVEGDGDVDLAIAHAFCSNASCGGPVQFSLLVNDGSGTMSQEAAMRGFPFGNTDFIVGVASADVDGDGDYDLMIQHGTDQGAEGASGGTQLARNDGTGHYTLEDVPLPTTCSGFGSAMTLGDIDGDLDLDLVLGRCGASFAGGDALVRHGVAVNDGSGNFTNESDARFDGADWGGAALTAGNATLGDIDYDGDLDFIALETANMGGMHHLQLYLNDGSGSFTYSSAHSQLFLSGGAALGADVEFADLDRDGAIDVWVGIGGDRVHEFFNLHTADDGLPADSPRGLTVADAVSDAVTLVWDLPQHAITSGHYRVYRSSSPGLDTRDRELVAVIGEHHGDEGLSVPITTSSGAAVLGHADASIVGGQLQFIDRGVLAGEIYQYAVGFTGTANTEAPLSPEVTAVVPAVMGADTEPPRIAVISPTEQDWYPHPRVVVQLADGGSGVDPDSVRVRFDQPLGDPGNGGRAAGADLSDLAYRLDNGVLVAAFDETLALPDAAFVTMSVTAADMDGNEVTVQQQFLATNGGGQAPTAVLGSSATAGAAPFPVEFDATGSDDGDGKLVRYEWYFGDGTTALGRKATHEYLAGGSYTATLLVRDNDGRIAIATTQVEVEGEPPPCTTGDEQACYSGPAGTEGVAMCVGGTQQCGPAGWGECVGEVTPQIEVCDDGIDNDCDGDGDGLDTDCGGAGDGSGGDASGGGSAEGGDAGGTDGATGGADGSGSDGAGATGDGDAAGCGCQQSEPATRPWWLLALAAAWPRRRRRAA